MDAGTYVGSTAGYRCQVYLNCWNDYGSAGTFMGNELADTYVYSMHIIELPLFSIRTPFFLTCGTTGCRAETT